MTRKVNGNEKSVHVVTIPIGTIVCSNPTTGEEKPILSTLIVEAIWGINGTAGWCWGDDGKGNLTHYTRYWRNCKIESD